MTKFQTFLISIILFSSLVTGFYVFLGDMSGSEGYDIDTTNDTSYQLAYNKTEEISTSIQQSYDDIVTMETNVVAQFFTGLVEVVRMTKTIIVAPYTILTGSDGIINTLTGSQTERGISLPSWISGLLITLTVILLVFAFIGVIIKYKA